jgi:predicted transcriptional regulator
MTTLRDIWIEQDLTSREAAKRAHIRHPTLYKMNRKERVSPRTIVKVCKALGITRAEYDALDVCPMADRYRSP